MDIFLRFPEYVDYSVVFKNPAVVLDYAALKRRIAHFKEELVAAASAEDRADSGLGRGHRRHRYFNRV
jgi:hypothetical protein